MYFLTEEEQLVGKTVAFTHMAQFAEAITIVTEDKGILVVEQNGDSSWEKETHVYNEWRARKYVLEHKYLREELNKRGLITNEDIKEYQEQQRKAFEEQKERNRIAQEKRELELLKDLQKKHGNQ